MENEYKEKLDDKIKALNSTRVYKKITPKGTLDWYIKWISSGIIILAVMCRSIPEVPKIYDIVLSFIGTAGWFWVGLIWHDRALIVLNAVLCLVLGTGILRFLVT